MPPSAPGSLGYQRVLHSRSLLRALVFRDVYVAARSWAPGVENGLRHHSLLGALVLRACHVTARSWEPWCEELFALPIALSCGVSGPSWGSFWGSLEALLDCLGALLGRLGALLGHIGALLGAFWAVWAVS